MRSKIVFALLVFFSCALNAQNKDDKKAQEILNGLSAKYKSFKSLKATFSILIENGQDKSTQEQKGVLYLKGKKYKLEISGQEIICDGTTRWTYLKDANEVQIDNYKPEEGAITPSNVFTIYENGWQSKYTGEQKLKNVLYQLVELIPSDGKSKNVFKVKLMINKIQKTIASAKIFDKNGSIQTISVEKLIPDGANEDSIYVFNSQHYPGSEVIDLR